MLSFIPKALLPYYGLVFVFSLCINILGLFSVLHFYLIITRVIPSGNVATLLFITVLVLVAQAVMSLLEGVRTRLLTRLSNRLERDTAGAVIQAMFARGNDTEYEQGAADLQTVKRFLGGTGIVAFFDLPWLPMFLGIVYILHPTLGLVACGGAGLLLLLLLVNEGFTKRAVAEHSQHSSKAETLQDLARRNVQTLYSMGMRPSLVQRWHTAGARDLFLENRVFKRLAASAASNKAMSLLLGLILYSFGAMLVIYNQITIGAMIVARILMGRAVMPLNQMLGGWKEFQEARLATRRLRHVLNQTRESRAAQTAPRVQEGPSGLLVEDLRLGFGGQAVLEDVSLALQPGRVLAVTGASGSGKSTLLRTVAGLHVPEQGRVLLDGHDLISRDDPELRRKFIGYLPQDVELQAISVGQNIGRLESGNSDAVIAAAQLAGAHETILRLPKGYDTKVAPKAANLSAGQRQRIALARALYKTPRLILLDEPDANLDETGRQSLAQALKELKNRDSLVLISTHQPWIKEIQDQELCLDTAG
ncbi:MAG: ATP-binding cassette domain-containing protein [Desulfohalobiaceae bacterium]|nr:ATP-binding cassette domain-containing protein [Desulfohalobiaceae bacterium]